MEQISRFKPLPFVNLNWECVVMGFELAGTNAPWRFHGESL